MKRWIQPNPPPPSKGWQSRAEILREHYASLSPLELLRVRPDLYAQTWGWDFENKRYASGRLALYEELERRAGFRWDQPRWPKGSGDDSGRWSGGAGTGPQETGPGRGPIRGHHFVDKALYKNLSLRPETRQVFDEGTTGPLHAGPHRWSKEHKIYNDAVAEHFQRFLKEHRIQPEQMTPEQAQRFVSEVKGSRDPRIRSFNTKIFMREIRYWFRRMPRGSE